ncbi:copper resistance CopC family protein [Cellulomonas endophytica]|uniref:copper resistance CopC family protein n=1 Tax=Cellulomonas endophytica TaxID=2494735 RepID=UPI001011011C|nr:copper resistance CopC family protein [Cellulomonas endophytica]
MSPAPVAPARRTPGRPAPERAPRTGPAPAVVVAAVAALVALLGLGGLATAVPAAAHDALVGSSPAPDETVPASPERLTLQFGDVPLDLSNQLVLTGPDGAAGPALTPVVEGTTVVADLPEPLAAGAWTLAWRVVSADGHPVEGTIAFTVAPAAPAATPEAAPVDPAPVDPAPSAAAPSPEPSADGAAGTTAGPEPTPSSSASTTAADERDDDGGSARTALWIGSGIAVLAGVVAAVWVLLSSRRQGPGAGTGRP